MMLPSCCFILGCFSKAVKKISAKSLKSHLFTAPVLLQRTSVVPMCPYSGPPRGFKEVISTIHPHLNSHNGFQATSQRWPSGLKNNHRGRPRIHPGESTSMILVPLLQPCSKQLLNIFLIHNIVSDSDSAKKTLQIMPRFIFEEQVFAEVTIAHNVVNKEDVAIVLSKAEAAGAKIIKVAQDVFWGGHSGYFSDPDGHLLGSCLKIHYGNSIRSESNKITP